MAGLATAGRPCQPTNPPPKRYKPPIMTKAQQYGNMQQQKINPKIPGPCCGASTHSHVASYSNNLTNTRKPTMTPPIGRPHPTLQKNDEQYAPVTVFKNAIITTDTPTQAPTTRHPVNPLSVNSNKETNPHDRPNGPPNCPRIPYRPPKLTKNTSHTILKPPSTSKTPQTPTQPTSQKNCNRLWMKPVAVELNHASPTRNKIHTTMQPVRPATNDTTSSPNLTPKTNQLQAITVHPRASHPTTFDSSRYHEPQPINQPTIRPTNTQLTEPATCDTNYTTDKCTAPHQCTTPLHGETNPAPDSWRANLQFSPTTMTTHVTNCEPRSILSKGHPSSILALIETVSQLEETLNQLFSINNPILNIV